jgi:hypothetical protein
MTPQMKDYAIGEPYILLGLKWKNKDFKNSCNIDSWMTFLKLIALKHPKMILRCLGLKNDPASTAIKEIVEGYSTAKDSWSVEVVDGLSRSIWCDKVLNIPPQDDVIDLFGSEPDNVFAHLDKSMRTEWSYKCKCGSQHEQALFIGVETANEVKDIAKCLESACAPKYGKKCHTCKQPFQFQQVTAPDSTWLIRLNLFKDDVKVPELPIFLTFGQKTFKMAYISFADDKNQHQCSMHLIQDQWFHFDGLKNKGALKKVKKPTRYRNWVAHDVIYARWS